MDNGHFKREILPLFEEGELSSQDKLATAVEMIAAQIAAIVNKVSQDVKDEDMKMLVTGGGTYNTFLMERLRARVTEKVRIVKGNDKDIQFKEAMVMGFLGVLRLRREINLVASVSGAREDSIGGGIF